MTEPPQPLKELYWSNGTRIIPLRNDRIRNVTTQELWDDFKSAVEGFLSEYDLNTKYSGLTILNGIEKWLPDLFEKGGEDVAPIGAILGEEFSSSPSKIIDEGAVCIDGISAEGSERTRGVQVPPPSPTKTTSHHNLH